MKQSAIKQNELVGKLIKVSITPKTMATKFTFVVDISNSGAKSKPLNWTLNDLEEEFMDSYEEPPIGSGKPPSMHEQFSEKCIPYIDLDCLDSTDRLGYIKKLRESIAQVFGIVTVILADRSGFSIKHDKYKISLRAYIRGAGYFSCPPACGKFMIEKFKPLLGDAIDGLAYKRKQNMGLVYNTKMGDDRVLELLEGDERQPWNEQSIEHTLIQNIEGETKCLDPESWEHVEQIYVSDEGGEGIERVLRAAKSLMPDLEIRKVWDGDGHQLIEFIKSSDECTLCKRIHVGTRVFAVSYPSKAFLNCHDEDAGDLYPTIR
jgi:hypothetical protein